jgi:HlyD family secretion protein
MTTIEPPLPSLSASTSHNGAAMDRVLPRSRWPRAPLLLALAALGLLLAVTALWWLRAPRLHTVDSPQLAAVVAGEFRDELALRAHVEPIRTVQLDAAEAGSVEAVYARDGDTLAAGAPLYKLRNSDLDQLLIQRSAEVAQQIANMSVQRSVLSTSLAQHRRELAQLQATQLQAESEYQRFKKLAAVGFVSTATLEQAQRQQQLSLQLLQQARQDQRLESETSQRSLDEMERAVQGLQHGLQLLESSRDRLQQSAPIAGRLSGFELQVGTTVRLGDRLGRIDDADSGVQLQADVDEFYLPRLQAGQIATTSSSGTLALAQTLPQIQSGKARVLLRWPDHAKPPADLRPGQAVDLRLQLSAAAPALLLPDGPGVQTQLYVQRGRQLQRRTVVLGRRAAGQVEVRSGLQAGDVVLISQPPSDEPSLSLP